MTCKVLFLGAGASVGVGPEYPLCNQIFDFLEEYKNGHSVNYRDDWNRFDQFRKKHSHQFEGLKVEAFFTKLEKLISDNQATPEEYKEYKYVLGAISRMLSDRFGFNNDDYKHLKNKKRLNYLENMIIDSNYIITLNWDNLCEFILADHNLWFPTDGYGISIELIGTRNNRRVNGIKPLPTIKKMLFPNSKILILKLHGSMGWKLNAPNALDINDNPENHKDTLFLTGYNFLNLIPNLGESCVNIKPATIRDKNDPDLGGEPYHDSCVIYPSYNKPYEKFPILEPIWKKANEALEKATEVIFVGYSLPNEDKPIRELINVLHARISSGKVKVKCIIGQENEKSIENAERYQQLLGNKIEIIYEIAEDYFTSSISQDSGNT